MLEKTAEKIINSMYNLIAEVGYEKSSINKICSNIGVTKSSFYHFFESKEQAFLEIVKFSYTIDFENSIREFEMTNTYEGYKSILIKTGYETISAYESDSSWRKVCAEIDLQSERNSKVMEIVDNFNVETLAFLKKILEHGVMIGVFPKDFNVKENAEILFTAYLGLDTVILYNLPIDAKNVIKKTIERMF